MSATGNDIRMYQKCLGMAEDSHINLSINGDNIVLTKRSNDNLYGYFDNLNEVYNFLCGFDWGFEKGKVVGVREL